jgi:hypothetical protein
MAPEECPVCQGTDLARERPIYDRVGIVHAHACYRRCCCENCGAEWFEIFNFYSTVLIPKP